MLKRFCNVKKKQKNAPNSLTRSVVMIGCACFRDKAQCVFRVCLAAGDDVRVVAGSRMFFENGIA